MLDCLHRWRKIRIIYCKGSVQSLSEECFWMVGLMRIHLQVSSKASSQASSGATPPNLSEADKATLGVVVAAANASAAASVYAVGSMKGIGIRLLPPHLPLSPNPPPSPMPHLRPHLRDSHLHTPGLLEPFRWHVFHLPSQLHSLLTPCCTAAPMDRPSRGSLASCACGISSPSFLYPS
jgi:hypothetical protein